MRYREMIENAKAHGLTNEHIMWESIEDVEGVMDLIKEQHPKEYWHFMRKQHGRLHKGHYDEDFAKFDVSKLRWTDKQGTKHEGAYWTCQQIEEATKGMSFSADVNKWDKFVAFNAMKADLAHVFDDSEILKAAHAFWFADEDWEGHDKIWRYFCMKWH